MNLIKNENIENENIENKNIDFKIGDRICKKYGLHANGILVKIDGDKYYIRFFGLGNLLMSFDRRELERSGKISGTFYEGKKKLILFWIDYINDRLRLKNNYIVKPRKDYQNINLLREPNNISLTISSDDTMLDELSSYSEYDLLFNQEAEVIDVCDNFKKLIEIKNNNTFNYLNEIIDNNYKYKDIYLKLKTSNEKIGWVQVWMVRPLYKL